MERLAGPYSSRRNTTGTHQYLGVTGFPMDCQHCQGNSKNGSWLPTASRVLTCNLVEFCSLRHVPWAVENPGRSFMWGATLLKNILHSLQHFQTTFGCAAKLVHTIPTFQDLECHCVTTPTSTSNGDSSLAEHGPLARKQHILGILATTRSSVHRSQLCPRGKIIANSQSNRMHSTQKRFSKNGFREQIL